MGVAGVAEVAVVGVGAIGGVCAARLAAAGREPVCCVRRRFDVLRLDAPDGARRLSPRVETDPSRVGPARWVLLATKAHQTAGASAWLARLVGAETTLAVLQNGVEHVARLSPFLDPARILPVVVDCPAACTAPGVVTQRRVARLTVPDGARGEGFAELFHGSGVAVDVTPGFPDAAWRKLCVNVVGGALAALAGAPLSQVRHPRLLELARALAFECAAVARAEGADVPDAFAEEVAARAASGAAGGMPSTLQDRLAGRPLEADARNGAVVRIGARHGLATPTNAHALALLLDAHEDPASDRLPELVSALR